MSVLYCFIFELFHKYRPTLVDVKKTYKLILGWCETDCSQILGKPSSIISKVKI